MFIKKLTKFILNRRCKISNNLFAFKPYSAYISSKATVTGNGTLDFNVSQTTGLINKNAGYITLADDSVINIKGNFVISSGCRLGVMKGAELSLGSGYVNYDSKIYCFNKITIGEGVAISENVIIRDSDNHHLNYNDCCSLPINIGDNVWIGMNSTI